MMSNAKGKNEEKKVFPHGFASIEAMNQSRNTSVSLSHDNPYQGGVVLGERANKRGVMGVVILSSKGEKIYPSSFELAQLNDLCEKVGTQIVPKGALHRSFIEGKGSITFANPTA